MYVIIKEWPDPDQHFKCWELEEEFAKIEDALFYVEELRKSAWVIRRKITFRILTDVKI